MKIEVVLPAGLLPFDLPTESTPEMNSGADNLMFTAALEAETLKMMAAAPALPSPAPKAAQSNTIPNVDDTRGLGASLVLLGIVQFLTPDSETPKAEQTSSDSETTKTTPALESLHSLTWNEAAGQILPDLADTVAEPEQPATRFEMASLAASVVEPLGHQDLAAVPEALQQVISSTDKPVEFRRSAPMPERPASAIRETPEDQAVSAESERTPVTLVNGTPPPERRIQHDTAKTDAPRGGEVDSNPPNRAPAHEFKVTETRTPAGSQQPDVERQRPQGPQHPTEHTAPPTTSENQPFMSEAQITVLENTGTEVPRSPERSTPSPAKSESVITTETAPVPVTADSAGSRPHDENPRKPVAREAKVETSAKVNISRDSEPVSQASVASTVRSATKAVERHESAAPAVVPHTPKHPGVDTVKPVEILSADQTTQWTQIEKNDLVSQLVEKARSLRLDRSNEIVVSLKPESLGRVSLRASLVDRTMVATITADSDRVRQLLQLELPAIQRSLQETGVVARVAVSEQTDLNFGNNLSHGQPRFRQHAEALPFREEPLVSQNPAATIEVADARYSTHSVHFIA